MSKWFQQRRQEYIFATLKTFGQVRRDDLVREFEISTPLASSDIQTFLATNPARMKYDVSAKAYTIVEDERDALAAKEVE